MEILRPTALSIRRLTLDNFVIGNMVWNAGLIGVVGFFIRKWISNIENTTKEASKELIKTAKELRTETKETAKELAHDTAEAAEVLNSKIERIYVELKTANGRTAKLEGEVIGQKALCVEKHKRE